jgi:hypothetical protein
MFRKFMSRLLGADLEPAVSWSESESMQAVARISVEVPRGFSGKETMEQVLCDSGNGYVLFTRRVSSGMLSRISFGKQLNGREMRLAEWQPGPPPAYRLQLSPLDGATVTYAMARPTWFRLWHNESHTDLGPGICSIDSTDREVLKDLRHKFLDGKIPDSLQTEEEMWQRVNSLSSNDRRAAMAALAMQSLGAVDRAFHEAHPDAGPVPEGLKPLFDRVQNQIQEINRTAAGQPVDPALADLMQRLVADAATCSPTNPPGARPSDDLDEASRS